jgi:Ca-activated chloride channel family protein
MRFAQPLWLLAGLTVIAAIIWIYFRLDRRQRAALAEFASSHLLAKLTASFSPGRRLLKRALFVTALAFTFVALARPQFGFHWEEEKQRGIDILFAIDTSKSMLTQDVTPDRLTRAKMAITDLVRKLDGDRVGLIAFAGDAFLQAPLTLDYNAFEDSLDSIDTATIPRGGTDISSAIQEADAAFNKESKTKKILVLVTDGEDLEAKGIDAAKAAAADGLTIYTVGVGTASGGLIPVPGSSGGTDFVKDDSGQFVKSHLDESTLSQIAQATGGIYAPLGQHGEGLQTIYENTLAQLPKQELSSKSEKVFEDRYQWPLAAALGCLLASLMIGTRRSRKSTERMVRNMPAATVAVVALLVFAPGAQASPQSAEQSYKKGDYSDAEKQYETAVEAAPGTAPLQYNMGDSAYKTGEFDKALPAFQKALNTDDLPVQEQAYYNMGNTQYRLGQKSEKSSPQDTMKTWQSAVDSYDAALKLQPDDTDAKFNRDFVEKKLQQLQKQNPQQKKQDQKDQKQDQKQDQKRDQKNQQQNQQNQQNQQQQNSPQNQNQQQQQNQNQNQQQNQPNQSQNQQGQQNQNQQPQQQPGSPGQQDQQANQQQQNPSQGQQNQPNQQNQKPSDSQQNTAQNGDQQKQQGQQGQQPQGQDQQQGQQQKDQQSMAQAGLKPAGQRGQTVPDKDQSKPAQGQPAQAVAASPDQLSKEEARELLNSLKGEEHILPVTADSRNMGHPKDQPALKDW